MNHPLDNLGDDLREHIERETRENAARGMTPEEARAAALRKFGNFTRVMEDTRAVWTRLSVDQLVQDTRYGLRRLRRNPGFTLAVVATLALGIGMNTAVFSVVNAVLLRELAYPNADRLVWVGHYDPNLKRDIEELGALFDWRAHAHSIVAATAYGPQQSVMAHGDGFANVRGVVVAGDFFALTGAQPAGGRLFGPDEDNVVVLSWDLFQREFAGAQSAIGSSVNLDGQPVTIAGVLPPGFRFQFPRWWVTNQPGPVEAYIPLRYTPGRFGNVVAKLKPGVFAGTALAELGALEKQTLETDRRWVVPPFVGKLRIEPLEDQLVGNVRPALLVALGAGTFVLLIACVNIANLLLARGTARQREIAVRAAIGAGQTRLIRQLLAESVILAVAGGVAGLLVARGALAVLLRLEPYAIPRLTETTIDGEVLAVTFAASLVAGLGFGLGPAVSLGHIPLHVALKDGLRASMGAPARRARRLLVASELALAMVLLTGAGLMVKSLWRMTEHAPGFEPERILLLSVVLRGPDYNKQAARDAYLGEVLQRIETLPGVRAAGSSNWVLFGAPMQFPGDRMPQTHVIRINVASPGFFQTLGMRLIAGRWLSVNDSGQAVVLNQGMARALFGANDPIGQAMPFPLGAKVVGVVADLKYSKLDAPPPEEIFVRTLQGIRQLGGQVAVRIAGDPARLVPTIRKLVGSIDSTQTLTSVETLEQQLTDSIAPRRFNLFLLRAFAAAALLLAVVGIYGVIAYAVAERTREIGVRMALGAQRGQVVGMVLREGLALALGGIAAGLAAAWGLTRLMASLLYDVAPHDVATFVAVGLVLAATAVIACMLPAMRAARVDPVVALRYE